MNSNDNFYITLPSNSGRNKNASNYIVNLPQNIRLDGEWEVALVELIYPYSFYNVQELAHISLVMADKGIYPKGKRITLLMSKVKEGHYGKVEDLLEALQQSLPSEYSDKLIFDYNRITNRVTLKISPPIIGLNMPDFLLYMLGYDASTFDYHLHNGGIAPYPPDMRAGVSIIYIYCDLVEYTTVGDTMAPLLRAVPAQGTFGDIISNVFNFPHYLPVLKKEFQQIEIAIKNDQNKSLALQYGKTLVKLHFRRKQKALFM